MRAASTSNGHEPRDAVAHDIVVCVRYSRLPVCGRDEKVAFSVLAHMCLWSGSVGGGPANFVLCFNVFGSCGLNLSLGSVGGLRCSHVVSASCSAVKRLVVDFRPCCPRLLRRDAFQAARRAACGQEAQGAIGE